MRLIPSSFARPSIAFTSSWVKVFPHSPPKCHVPNPITETLNPVSPRVRYFMRELYAQTPSGRGRSNCVELLSQCAVYLCPGTAGRSCAKGVGSGGAACLIGGTSCWLVDARKHISALLWETAHGHGHREVVRREEGVRVHRQCRRQGRVRPFQQHRRGRLPHPQG